MSAPPGGQLSDGIAALNNKVASNLPPNILTLVANWAWFRPQYLPGAR